MSKINHEKKIDANTYASSTPYSLRLPSGRPPIHQNDISPIAHNQNNDESSLSDLKYNADGEISFTSSKSSVTTHSPGSQKNYISTSSESEYCVVDKRNETTQLLYQNSVMVFIGVVLILMAVAFGKHYVQEKNPITIKELRKKYPLQKQHTWEALSSGVEEVESFNKPSVFLFLYEKDSKNTLDNLLLNIATYSSCALNQNCNVPPIILTHEDLNTVTARTDYGYIIDKYKPELEKRAVMVVKNLNKISGQVAQAFHSMCDEFNPLVSRSIFFFTIQVDSFKFSYENEVKIVEEILKSSWDDLGDDIFYPLFVRLTSMILTVTKEN